MASDWFKIAEFPKSKDLSHLEAYLAHQQVEYKIESLGSQNVLLYKKASDINSFKMFLNAVNQGVIDINAPASEVSRALASAAKPSVKASGGDARRETISIDMASAKSNAEKQAGQVEETEFAQLDTHQRDAAFSAVNMLLIKAPARLWLSILFIALGVAGFYVQELFLNTSLFHSLTFLPLEKAVASGQPWRILTPAFLHFGLLHIVFNALWLWILGGRLELFLGRGLYLGLFVFTALVSNYTQFFMEPRGIFGGLSGVVYGYLGALLVLNRTYKNPLIYIMPSLAGMMLLFLGLGVLGIIDNFMEGKVANGAHIGGLVAGVIFGLVLTQLRKTGVKSSN